MPKKTYGVEKMIIYKNNLVFFFIMAIYINSSFG